MTTKTISTREYNNLVKKSKVGWGRYYGLMSFAYERDLALSKELQELRDKIEGESFPPFLEKEIQALYKEVRKGVECPICFDEIPDFKIASCGHKYCASCLAKIDKCAVCRKTIYKTQTPLS